MMLLGVITPNREILQEIILNFGVFFLSQLSIELLKATESNKFPDVFTIYKSVLSSLVASFAMYYLNKASVERATKQKEEGKKT